MLDNLDCYSENQSHRFRVAAFDRVPIALKSRERLRYRIVRHFRHSQESRHEIVWQNAYLAVRRGCGCYRCTAYPGRK